MRRIHRPSKQFRCVRPLVSSLFPLLPLGLLPLLPLGLLPLLPLGLLALLPLGLLASCGAPPGAADQALRPPETRAEAPVGSNYHGTWVADPYRWLENQDGEETARWVAAQNRVTKAFLSRVAGRDALSNRLTELWNFERYGPPARAGAHWFHGYNDGLKNQSVLYKSAAPGDKGKVFLDPNTLSADGTIAVTGLSFSKDGRYLAYAFSKSGSDWRDWKVIDVETGKHLDDHLRWTKFTTATWLPDASGFFYASFEAPEEGKAYEASNKGSVYRLHKLGTDQAEDPVVYADPDHPERSAGARLSDDGQFLVFTISSGTDARNRVAVLDLDQVGNKPRFVFPELEASYRFLGNDERVCYFLTDDGAERRRIIAVDVAEDADEGSPEKRTVVPQSADTLESAQIVAERLVLVYLRDAHHVVRVCKLDGSDMKTVALPAIGAVSGLTGKRADEQAFFHFQSFVHPPSVYGLDLGTGETTLLHQPEVAFDPADFVTKQVALQSADGTRIPMFLVYKKGLRLSGDNPTYLYGYGGFNISLKPRFKPERIAWLEMGGLFAQPTLRGGGEFGRAWHEAGMLKDKQRVFDDFTAAARYLLRNQYTSSARLAIGGASNGGLLVGAALIQNPGLFGAAIPEVGVLDMLRYHKFTIGHAWIPEYGSSEDPDMFPTLRAYSPLHNIEDGGVYPATMVMTGDHDDRVLPGHSYKFAATLQKAQGGKPPILIRIGTDAGHGAGKPTRKRIAEATDRWAFLIRALRME